MESKVYTVDEVIIKASHSHPSKISISANGTTRTSGWTNGRFIPHHTDPNLLKPGIYELDFVADPSTGIFTNDITPITTNYEFNTVVPANGQGKVIIYSETNSIEKALPSSGLDMP